MKGKEEKDAIGLESNRKVKMSYKEGIQERMNKSKEGTKTWRK